jgi:hypothetical protein
MGSPSATSPRFMARMSGVFYLLYVAIAGLAGFARRGTIVGGDAAATATNILAHESLYTLGFACDFFSVACYVVVLVLFYQLFKPVNSSVSMLAASFGFMGCIIMAVGGIFQLAPLTVLGQTARSTAFSAEQLQAQAYLLLRLYNSAYSIALIAFGLFDLLIGYLIFNSTFLPRSLGVLMSLAGLAFLPFLAPAFGARYLYWILPVAIGEVLVILWLLVKGVDVERWKKQAHDTATTPQTS